MNKAFLGKRRKSQLVFLGKPNQKIVDFIRHQPPTPPTRIITITLSPNDEDLGQTNGSGTYDVGTAVKISAIPSLGCKFVKWSDGSEEAIRDLVANEDISLVAYFERIKSILEYFPNKEHVNPFPPPPPTDEN